MLMMLSPLLIAAGAGGAGGGPQDAGSCLGSPCLAAAEASCCTQCMPLASVLIVVQARMTCAAVPHQLQELFKAC